MRVGVKVRYVPFETRQRSLTLPSPPTDAAVIGDAAVELLDRLDHSRKVRLLGVRAEMGPPSPAVQTTHDNEISVADADS